MATREASRSDLEEAGFREDCSACRRAVEQGNEACKRHYTPTHLRSSSPLACPTCGGGKRRDREVCGRCRAAGT